MRQERQAELIRALRHQVGPETMRAMGRDPIVDIRDLPRGGREMTISYGGERDIRDLPPWGRGPTTRHDGKRDIRVRVVRNGQADCVNLEITDMRLDRAHHFVTGVMIAREEAFTELNRRLGELPPEDIPRPLRGAMLREARRIALAMSGGMAPRALARNSMRKLLDPEEYAETMRIAGARATLREHTIIRWDRNRVREAHRQNPNAALIWITSPNMENPIKYRTPSPEKMIGDIRETMTRLARGLGNPQEIWDTFTRLPPGGVNRNPDMNPWAGVMIANLALKAGAMPSPMATMRIRLEVLERSQESPVTLGFIRESARPERASREEQRRLLEEYRNLQPRRISIRDMQRLRAATESAARPIPWEDLAPTPRPKRAGHPMPTASPGEIREFLDSPDGDALEGIARESVQVLARPGESLILTARGHREPALHLERGPGGRILRRSGKNNQKITLPGAWEKETEGRLTGWGIWEQTAASAGGEWLEQAWTGERKLPRRQGLVQPILQAIRRRGAWKAGDIDRQIQEGLRDMTDPDILARALRLAGKDQITLDQHNIACLGVEETRRLEALNPGALAWCMERMTGTEELRHPGQIIQEARRGLEASGVDPDHWRTISRLSMENMRRALDRPPEETRELLNLMGEARLQPGPAQLETLGRAARAGSRSNPRDKTLLLMTRLLGPQAEEIPPEWEAVRDYVNHVHREEGTIGSRTWRTLAERAREWHRNTRRANLEQQWDRMMERRGGRVLAWESLLGPQQLDRVTVTPLTDERMLLEESIEMQHCVFSYGENAHDGHSRIFAMSRDGDRLATMEITRHGGTWKVNQVRGRRNHQVGPELQQAALEVAMMYNRAGR